MTILRGIAIKLWDNPKIAGMVTAAGTGLSTASYNVITNEQLIAILRDLGVWAGTIAALFSMPVVVIKSSIYLFQQGAKCYKLIIKKGE